MLLSATDWSRQGRRRVARQLTSSISQRSLVGVEGSVCLVPCDWAGLDVTAHIGPNSVEFVGPTGAVEHVGQRFSMIGMTSASSHESRRRSDRSPPIGFAISVPPLLPFGDRIVDAHGPKQASRVFAKVLA